jgi:hypothetical protein
MANWDGAKTKHHCRIGAIRDRQSMPSWLSMDGWAKLPVSSATAEIFYSPFYLDSGAAACPSPGRSMPALPGSPRTGSLFRSATTAYRSRARARPLASNTSVSAARCSPAAAISEPEFFATSGAGRLAEHSSEQAAANVMWWSDRPLISCSRAGFRSRTAAAVSPRSEIPRARRSSAAPPSACGTGSPAQRSRTGSAGSAVLIVLAHA